MRVLIYTPVYRLEPETVQALLTLDRAGCDVQMMFDYENPPRGENDTILYKYQRVQAMFKRGDWDAMLVVESDVIPPVDALARLLAVQRDHNADIVNGLYYFRRGNAPVANAIRMTRDAKWVDQSWSLFPNDKHRWVNQVIPTTGLGLGCSLIMAHVMHGVAFRSGGETACDWSFANDCLAGGYKIYSDTAVRCGHKMPDGSIIWPDNDGGYEIAEGDTNNDYHLTEALASVEKARQHDGATV